MVLGIVDAKTVSADTTPTMENSLAIKIANKVNLEKSDSHRFVDEKHKAKYIKITNNSFLDNE